jgi:ACT domain-containing protein
MKITEELIRKITLLAMNELGENSSAENVKKIVNHVIASVNENGSDVQKNNKDSVSDSKKIILTSYGLNKPGVVYRISQVLAEQECDIQDLSQKILQDYFTIIMFVDISHCKISLNDLKEKLQKLSDEMSIRIIVQHEEVFQFMHRI